MANNDNYEISDSFLGRVGQYASSVWHSWDKDFDEYAEDALETNAKSDEENFVNTSLQHSVHSMELVSHLVGSVLSNDYTKERIHELGSAIAQTESYTSAIEAAEKLEIQIDQASEQFMKEHPQVQTAFMASQEKIDDAISYVTKEAQTFANNHPDITGIFKSTAEIAALIPAVNAAKVARGSVVTYTAIQAEKEIAKLDLNSLKPKEVEQELHRIINHLDTTPKNVNKDATTALYSGILKDDMKQFVNDPNYALLDNTEAFKFLDKLYEKDLSEIGHPLIPALKKVYNTDEIDFNDRNTPANIFINGDDSVFPRQKGAWDIISHQFVKGSEGNVLTIIGEKASAQRVFKGTEFVTAALNKNITHLDGVNKIDLFKTLEKEPSLHHQLNHFKTTHYTRTEVAKALDIKDPLSLTPDKIDDFLNSSTPEAKEISAKIEDFKTNIDHTATEAMHKELGENRHTSPIIERGEAVHFTKTDAALAGLAATVAINSNETETSYRDISEIDVTQYLPQSIQNKNVIDDSTYENNQTQYDTREEDYNKEYDLDTYLSQSVQRTDTITPSYREYTTEQTFNDDDSTTFEAQRIYNDMAERNGWNNDYGNDYDRGMEID